MKPVWLRVAPSACVAALLVTAALAPFHRARARSGEPTTAQALTCATPAQTGSGSSGQMLYQWGGVEQPIAYGGNLAGCEMFVRVPDWGWGQFDVAEWDPVALAPDPTTVALRSASFDISSVSYSGGSVGFGFGQPLVLRHLTNAAEPPRSTIALRYRVTSQWADHEVFYDAAETGDQPVALSVPFGEPASPLPGAHPVLSHNVCAADAAGQQLYVVQSVRTASTLLDTTTYEVLQRFRVPERVALRWAEFAFGPTQARGSLEPGNCAFYDAEPPAATFWNMPPPLAQQTFYRWFDWPSWAAQLEMEPSLTLEPDRDYWMVVRVDHDYRLYARALDGSESDAFLSTIGPMSVRRFDAESWQPRPGLALDFRLIGVPSGVLAVPPSGPRPSLQLRVAPNPARGFASVSWSGGRGALRLEVIDARGRRVASTSADANQAGRWVWDGRGEDGRAAPPGIYHVRAVDAGGRFVTERLALVR